jgi:pyrophosphatase PpaX
MKAVVFDIDGVLLDSFEANLKFFQNLMEKTGHRPPTRKEFPKLFHLDMMSVIRLLLKSESEEEIQRAFSIGKSRKSYNLYPVDLLTMPKNAKNVIITLKKNYKLGIVSSRIKTSIFEAPELAELKNYFDVVISYEDTFNHKPHPEPLLLAAKKLKINPKEIVYIGDVQNDLIAAKAAGMKIIIYSKYRFPQADACTSSFEEIPEIVFKL